MLVVCREIHYTCTVYNTHPTHHSFREIVGKKVVRALKLKDDGISHACVDFLCALMQPMHDNFDIRQEQMNKRSLLASTSFLELLLEPLKLHVVRCGFYIEEAYMYM